MGKIVQGKFQRPPESWTRRVLASTEASGNALKVLLIMAEVADQGGFVTVSYNELSQFMRMRKTAIQRVVKSLLSSGDIVLMAEGRGRSKPAIYRIRLQMKADFLVRLGRKSPKKGTQMISTFTEPIRTHPGVPFTERNPI